VSVIEMAIAPGRATGLFRVEVVRSAAGEASAEIALDVDALLARRVQVEHAVLASAVASRGAVTEVERPLREFGQALFAALLGSGEVSGRYRASAALAAEQGQGLRVVLRIDTPALAGLPWEAMYDAATGGYVCRREPLVRHVPVASPTLPLPVQPPLRILSIVSTPRGLEPLDAEREKRQLTGALARPCAEGLIEIHWASEATWAALQDMLLDGQCEGPRVFRTRESAVNLRGRLYFPELVHDLLRGPVSDCGVKALPIVAQLDVPCDVFACPLSCRVDGPVNPLYF
jgi:hypothetical protein